MLLHWQGLGLRDGAVLAVFGVVYLGMFLGGLPRLKLDRSGVALLGGIAMIALMGWSVEEAARAIDLPTLVLLFAFMVLSAQMRLGGFYTATARSVGDWPLGPRGLLAALIAVASALSAVFSNDVICLAMTPGVLRICLQRSLPPVPFLLALACAANIGSAATLIGNPQNMLIGSMLSIPFAGYLRAVALPVLLSLGLLWLWLAPGIGRGPQLARVPIPVAQAEDPPFDRWQSAKGLAVAAVLMGLFLFTEVSRPVAALVGAAVLLLSRRLHSAQVMGFVDWPLLMLFIGLFIVNHALAETGLAAQAGQVLAAQGVALVEPGVLAVVTLGLSNLVSNVPAVMLLLPHLEGSVGGSVQAGTLLALVSTLAGNLLLVGSIANLIVADLARQQGVDIDWRAHARVGIPVTLLSLLTVLIL